MAVKNCPRCGTALKIAGEKFVCPSCRVSLVRKSRSEPAPSPLQETPSAPPLLPAAVPVLNFTAQAPAPRPRQTATLPILRNGVLAGAALFLLLGTVLTGYAFALTFSSPAEAQKPPEPIVEKPVPPPYPAAPAEDWRVTLSNLRQFVVTPPTTVTQAPKEEKPPAPPPRVNAAIDKGVAWLKRVVQGNSGFPGGLGGSHGMSTGAFALAGLTLLECGVPADDDAIKRVVQLVRGAAPQLMQTYEVATCIWFLDRLNQEDDKTLIRTLALRLIYNQGPMAGWGYLCQLLSPEHEAQLLELLGEKPLNANWRQEMNASLVPANPRGKPVNPFGGNFPRAANLTELPLFRWEPGKGLDYKPAGHEDNSLTQFAILALWSARKHGVPVERCLAFVEARFRNYQNADGSWGYVLRQAYRRDSMTCAGLLGLAVGRGLGKQSNAAADVKDDGIDKGLVFLGQAVGKPPPAPLTAQEQKDRMAELQKLYLEMSSAKTAEELRAAQAKVFALSTLLQRTGRPGGPVPIVGADGWGDLYFLWSLERMCVVYDLKTVAGKDWYAWGSEIILKAQQFDGSWRDAFPGIPDTCFALLFLKRVNVVKDLTEHLKLLGKVKDPGNMAPAVRLPGEQGKPDER